MTSFTNHNGQEITVQSATKAQLRAMLADEAAENQRLLNELKQARKDIQTWVNFCRELAPHAHNDIFGHNAE